MSKIGVAVLGKSVQEISLCAAEARKKLTLPLEGRLAVEMEWLLWQRVRPFLEVEPDIREDQEMVGAYAAFDPKTRILKIRESVMRGCILKEPEALFTLCHEIGHISMHSEPSFFRRSPGGRLPKNCDPEWQADTFACEFLIGEGTLDNCRDPVLTLMHCGIPKGHAVAFVADLCSTRKLSPQEAKLERYLGTTEQSGFDF